MDIGSYSILDDTRFGLSMSVRVCNVFLLCVSEINYGTRRR